MTFNMLHPLILMPYNVLVSKLLSYLAMKFNFNFFKQSRSTKLGFSLVEVLVAFTIFTFVMTGVVWTLISAQRLGDSARNRLNALQQARASLEQVISSGYSDASLQVGSHVVTRDGLNGQYVVSEPNPNELKRIVMTYTYRSFGRNATVQLDTEVSNALH